VEERLFRKQQVARSIRAWGSTRHEENDMPGHPKNPKHKSTATLSGEFYLVVAADLRRGGATGKLRPVRVCPTVPGTRPGEAVIRVALVIEERALAPLLATPELHVRADDVEKPRLVVAKERP
jgi:hypothetical protein